MRFAEFHVILSLPGLGRIHPRPGASIHQIGRGQKPAALQIAGAHGALAAGCARVAGGKTQLTARAEPIGVRFVFRFSTIPALSSDRLPP
jgi:hypothetical protein